MPAIQVPSRDKLLASFRRSRRNFLHSARATYILAVLLFATLYIVLLQLPGGFGSNGYTSFGGDAWYGRQPDETYVSDDWPVDPPDWAALQPPDTPPRESLPRGAEWFPQLEKQLSPAAPAQKPFPEDLLASLYPTKPMQAYTRPPPRVDTTTSTFAQDWKPPKLGSRWKSAPRVQSDFSSGPPETSEARERREERRAVVKSAFVWAWEAYKRQAWAHDEVRPVSGLVGDPFNGWGATLIDSLDTLLLLGLPEEYSLAREQVRLLDFGVIGGRDWKKGFYIKPSDSDSEDLSTWPSLPVFETTIRYLGGLLSAYDLTGDKLMLDRAEELAQILSPAFDTPTGIPYGTLRPGREYAYGTSYQVSLAEIASMTLEFTRLSQLTGNDVYFHYVQRVTDFIDEKLAPISFHPPLLPTTFDPDTPEPLDGTYSFGGQADSAYEYYIKMVQLLGGSLPQYDRMFSQVMETAKKTIIREVTSVPGKTLLTIGQISRGSFAPVLEHLTCFAGAMIGLGSRLLDRKSDMAVAESLTQSCYYVGALTESGLQPEQVEFFLPDDPRQIVKVKDKAGNFLYDRPAGRPLGIKQSQTKYIGRPETIESVFYMYRLTGDSVWQDKGWRMFTSWVNATLAPHGFSSTQDVRRVRPTPMDNMESFVLAETLKYYYLLQSPPDLLSLDDYVLNTEAHPFLVNPDIKPGSQGFWSPSTPPSSPLQPEDTSRPKGAGTSAQLWQILKRKRQDEARPGPMRGPPKVMGGSGSGRGGGGLGGGGRLPRPAGGR